MNALLEVILADEDCNRVTGALAARAAELDQRVEELLAAMIDFWLAVPDSVDERSLKVWAAQFASRLATGTDLVSLPVIGRNPALPVPGRRPGSRIRSSNREHSFAGGAAKRPTFTTFRQVAEICAASSAVPQLSGETFTLCITIDHGGMKHPDEKGAIKMVGGLVKQLSELTGRLRPDHNGGFNRITFLERRADGQIRSTILAALPEFLIEPATRWLCERWLPSRVSGQSPVLPLKIDADCPRTSRGKMNRHWGLVRRLWTGVDPEAMIDGDYLFSRLGLRRQQLALPGDISGRRYNLSQSISPSSLRRQGLQGMALLSAWDDRAWTELFSGWELGEHQDRQAEERRQADEIAELERSYGPGALDKIALEARITSARSRWPWDARDRRRNWQGWW